jgi:hypothetical protein
MTNEELEIIRDKTHLGTITKEEILKILSHLVTQRVQLEILERFSKKKEPFDSENLFPDDSENFQALKIECKRLKKENEKLNKIHESIKSQLALLNLANEDLKVVVRSYREEIDRLIDEKKIFQHAVNFLRRNSASQLPFLKDEDPRRSYILREVRVYEIVLEMLGCGEGDSNT